MSKLRNYESGVRIPGGDIIATGVQAGFFDQLAAHPPGLSAQELAVAYQLSCPLCGDVVYQCLPPSPLGQRPMAGMSWPPMWTACWLDARIPIARQRCSSAPSEMRGRVWRSMWTL